MKINSDTLMSSLREMIAAEVRGDNEQYSRHETVVREGLAELFKAVNDIDSRTARLRRMGGPL